MPTKKPVKKPTKSAPKLSKKPTKKPATQYGAQQIQVLEGLDPVRKRPGMFIGSTGETGLHHLIWEVVDNSIDEAMAGYASVITTRLLPDGWVSVEDNGRGIPVDKHPKYKVSALELVLTKLHAGGKFGGEDSGYKVSGGLHGVGVSVVNALSTELKAQVKRDGKIWEQTYRLGKPVSKIKTTGTAKGTGTTISFKVDSSIFETTVYKFGTVLDRLRQHAYLTSGITLIAIDERESKQVREYQFHFEGGVASYVRHINIGKKPKHEAIMHAKKTIDAIEVEIALQYTEEYHENVFCFTNNILNAEGGTHLIGFRTALTRVLNNYGREKGFLKEKDANLSGDDVREGLTAVLSLRVPEPQFEGQTKAKLGNPEARGATESMFAEALEIFLEEHPRDAQKILEKAVIAARARKAARAARDTILRKGALEGLTLPGKLADCASKNTEQTELYLVEGDSAGGCFHGDVRVALTDGRHLSFKDLVNEQQAGKRHFGYTMRLDGHVGVEELLHARVTKKDAELINVVLDNGESIRCTPDHKFMVRNGSYIEAQHLQTGYSLMPLYRKISKKQGRITIDGYEMVNQPSNGRWEFTHVLSDAWNIEHGVYEQSGKAHRHHQDFDRANNAPTNIIRLSPQEHLALHREHAAKTLHRPDVIEKCRRLKRSMAFRQKMSQRMKRQDTRAILRAQAIEQWKHEGYKAYMKERFREFYQTHAWYRRKNRAQLQNAQQRYWSKALHRQIQAQRTRAHFDNHPERRASLSLLAKRQWSNERLLSWRAQKTKEQWTPEFRAKRKATLQATYYRKTIQVLRHIYDVFEEVDTQKYQWLRKEMGDRTVLRFETFVQRYFDGDAHAAKDAVTAYNHKVVRVERMAERADVYDVEVPHTHNFALASGIFVHNSAKQGRNREFQAILPLRGKILNVERARLDKMLSNNEITSLVIALGTGIGDDFDLEKLRYGRIIIMTDADVDGAHISTLLLTLFYRYFPEIINHGHLFLAQPPLYKVQVGKEVRWAFSDEERDAAVVAMIQPTKGAKKPTKVKVVVNEETGEEIVETESGRKANIQRYKGLGEMNPDQLWETTMDPASRVMKRVTVEDATRADEVFDTLMGADVAPRKRFISTHAKSVKNLDI